MTQTSFTVESEKLQIVMERIFDAPLESVWQTITDPELIKQFWGNEKSKLTIDKIVLRPGGEWRYVERDTKGNEHVFYGVYDRIIPQKLISNTFNYEPIGPGHEIKENVTLEEINGGTKITNVSTYQTREDLDGMVKWGKQSVIEKWERLSKLVTNLK